MTGHYSTFVVKLWCDECGQLVRGQIEHATTQDHAYFVKLEDMNTLITKYLKLKAQKQGYLTESDEDAP